MSMEYTVYTPLQEISDEIIPALVSELNKFDMICEIHPDVSFANSPGFVPFKFRLDAIQFPEIAGKDLVSGVEISIYDFEADEQGNPYFGSEEDSQQGQYNKIVSFHFTGVSDRFEFRFACLTSAVLTNLLNGIRSDDDWNMSKGSAAIVAEAWNEVKSYEEYCARELDIPYHEFEGWT